MSFLEHLDELRRRIVIALTSVLVGFVVALFFMEPILDFVYTPLRVYLKEGKFIYTEPTEAFMLRMKVAALAGLFLALPVVLFQLWRFVAPGLYANEKKFVVPFVALSTTFFTAGAAFAHYVAFPWAVQFFASFERADMDVHAADCPRLFSVCKDGTRDGCRVRNADTGVLSRQDWRRHSALAHPQLQVRSSAHFHHCCGAHAGD